MRKNKIKSFNQAVKKLNRILSDKQPSKINSSWIVENAPDIYRFIWKNIRTETGEIDWDNVTSFLKRKFQKRWINKHHLTKYRWEARFYEDYKEVNVLIEKYQNKMYVFLSVLDDSDRNIKDSISIAFVRIAQKGNILAIQKITELLRYTVDIWIEYSYRICSWKGYESEIENQIIDCIRRYRFTGSFIGYLFKTFEYRGRGLRLLYSYSLDEKTRLGDRRRVENVVKDRETNEAMFFKI